MLPCSPAPRHRRDAPLGWIRSQRLSLHGSENPVQIGRELSAGHNLGTKREARGAKPFRIRTLSVTFSASLFYRWVPADL